MPLTSKAMIDAVAKFKGSVFTMSRAARVESVVYDRSSLSVAERRVRVDGLFSVVGSVSRLSSAERTDHIARIGELLLLHHRVALAIRNENISLALLVDAFGPHATLELLRQRTLEFIQWPWEIGLSGPTLDDTSRPWDRLVAMDLSGFTGVIDGKWITVPNRTMRDPDRSAETGLAAHTAYIPARLRRQLVDEAVQCYRRLPKDLAKDAVEVTHLYHASNLLEPLGIPSSRSIAELTDRERTKLVHFALDVVDVAVMSSFGYAAANNSTGARVHMSLLRDLRRRNIVQEASRTLFRLEGVPDLRHLIRSGAIHPREIVSLRNTRDAEDFRAWIATCSFADGDEPMTYRYLEAAANPGGFLGTKAGKFLKAISVTALSASLGAGIGSVVAPGVGTLVGGSIGAMAGSLVSPAIDVALNVVDSCVLDSILRRSTPRYFVSKRMRQVARRNSGI